MLLPVAEVEKILNRLRRAIPNQNRIWKKITKERTGRTIFSSRNLLSTSAAPATKSILFFGTDNFSLQTLKSLNKWISKLKAPSSTSIEPITEANPNVRLAVCTMQMKDLVQPVKVYAEKNNLKVYQWPPDPTVIRNEGFDIGIVASFGHLIPKKLITAFPQGMLNVHASLLPRWRGASPIAHAIMAGDSKTGISIMEIKPHHFDIGKVLAKESIDIGCDQTNEELTIELAKIGGELMVRVLQDLDYYGACSFSQNENEATYAPCINKSFYNIDWNSCTSREVYNQSRALSGSGKLYSTWENTCVKVMFSNCLKPEYVDSFLYRLKDDDYKPGQVKYHKTKLKDNSGQISQENSKLQRFICIRCKSGWIVFEKFYYGTNKAMSGVDFFNGYISKNRTKQHFFVKRD